VEGVRRKGCGGRKMGRKGEGERGMGRKGMIGPPRFQNMDAPIFYIDVRLLSDAHFSLCLANARTAGR